MRFDPFDVYSLSYGHRMLARTWARCPEFDVSIVGLMQIFPGGSDEVYPQSLWRRIAGATWLQAWTTWIPGEFCRLFVAGAAEVWYIVYGRWLRTWNVSNCAARSQRSQTRRLGWLGYAISSELAVDDLARAQCDDVPRAPVRHAELCVLADARWSGGSLRLSPQPGEADWRRRMGDAAGTAEVLYIVDVK